MQTIILLSLIVWSAINPTQNLALLIVVGLVIAIASANQDITVDDMLKGIKLNIPDKTTMTPNGALFRTDKKGFLPTMIEELYY